MERLQNWGKSWSTRMYVELGEELDPEDSAVNGEDRSTLYPTHRLLLLSTVASLAILFAAGVITGIWITNPSVRECSKKTSMYSPLLDVVEMEEIVFEGRFNITNAYRGPPSPEIDAAWDKIVDQRTVRISPDEARAMGMDMDTLARGSSEGEPWYYGVVEVFHQLHCVNLIRQYTYYDYYSNPEHLGPSFVNDPVTLRIHVDHCIEALRQVIMCYGDTAIIPSHWVQNQPEALDWFKTRHQCRKLEPFMQYVSTHRAGNEQKKPAGAKELSAEDVGDLDVKELRRLGAIE